MPEPVAAFGRPLRMLGLGLLLLPGLAAAWIMADTFLEDDNFRVVSADLFRSGQLRPAEWQESLDEHAYRSVLNLRGGKGAESWYRQERAFAAAHELGHYDLHLSADVEPTVEDMERLVAAMRAAPKPLLVHCNRGADRSGLAAALFLYAVEGQPAAAARRQLSLWFGHFPWLGSGTGAMEAGFAKYVGAHAPARRNGAGRLPTA